MAGPPMPGARPGATAALPRCAAPAGAPHLMHVADLEFELRAFSQVAFFLGVSIEEVGGAWSPSGRPHSDSFTVSDAWNLVFIPAAISIFLEKVRKSSLKGRSLLRLLLRDVSDISVESGTVATHLSPRPHTTRPTGPSKKVSKTLSSLFFSSAPCDITELNLEKAH